MIKFQVGDHVQRINSDNGPTGARVGDTGIISTLRTGSEYITVLLDNPRFSYEHEEWLYRNAAISEKGLEEALLNEINVTRNKLRKWVNMPLDSTEFVELSQRLSRKLEQVDQKKSLCDCDVDELCVYHEWLDEVDRLQGHRSRRAP